MTKPTITYGHGFLYDCNNTTGWTYSNNGLTDPIVAIENGDWLKLGGTCDSTANEYIFHKRTADDLSVDTDSYGKYLVGFKTSAESAGLKAWLRITFSVGDPQDIDLGYSETWKVVAGDLTKGKTIINISFYADDDPDTVNSGTFYVLYDFLLLHSGTFTFPSVRDGIRLRFSNRYADIEIPGRVGDITQYLGAGSPEIVLTGNVKSNTGWGTPLLEYLYDNWFNSHFEPWQWFTSDLINCKVTVRDFNPFQIGQNSQRVWELRLKKFDGHCGSLDWAWEYYGIT